MLVRAGSLEMCVIVGTIDVVPGLSCISTAVAGHVGGQRTRPQACGRWFMVARELGIEVREERRGIWGEIWLDA